MSKQYILFCENCCYKRLSDGTDLGDMVQYQRSAIQSAVPKYDPKNKKIIQKKPINLPRQFKCPRCGRLITAKRHSVPPPPEGESKNEQDKPSGR